MIPAPPVPTLRLDPSSLLSPIQEPGSMSSTSAFGNYAFPSSSSSSRLPAHPRDGQVLEPTSREEEMVRPRGSVAPGGSFSESGAQEGAGSRERWDLDGLKEDKIEVNACESRAWT